ncbi:UNVERIFIED_CONTAM: 60S ribosomal protein L7-1 [Sesamum latifolium]|uniref:60S ribosomal protein L7-1 n=1 Tax=Sesamum latifolium TaxID=2727402 RepID=A0AAW2UEM9_9LAMI
MYNPKNSTATNNLQNQGSNEGTIGGEATIGGHGQATSIELVSGDNNEWLELDPFVTNMGLGNFDPLTGLDAIELPENHGRGGGRRPALNYIPEVVLKKRKNNEQWAIRRKLQAEERAKRLKSESLFIKKPEQFIREYRDKEVDLIQMKSRGKAKKTSANGGRVQAPIRHTHRRMLYSLRLRKIFSGVFVKASEGMMEILQKVEPYVTYGYPNFKSVKDLIYKKGVVKIDKERVPLTDNNVVEQELGQHNIICIEDIVNEIANVGKHFKAVTSFLCPFTLNNPEKALRGKKKRFEDGGDSGNRADHINDLISKMN